MSVCGKKGERGGGDGGREGGREGGNGGHELEKERRLKQNGVIGGCL